MSVTYVQRSDRCLARLGDTITVEGCDLVTPEPGRAACIVLGRRDDDGYAHLSITPVSPTDTQIVASWQQPEGGA